MTAGDKSLTARATPQPAGASLETLAVAGPRSLVDALESLGYDVDELLQGVGLSRRDLADPDARIPCVAWGRLVQLAIDVKPVQNLALKVASATPMGAYPLLDYLVLTCETVGDGIRQLVRYFRLVENPVTMTLLEEETPVRLVLSGGMTFAAEYTLALMVHHLRQETEGGFAPLTVSFTHRPDDVEDAARMFRCRLDVASSWSGLTIAPEVWQLPLRRRDGVLRRVLEQAAAHKPPSPEGIVTELQRLLTIRLPAGETDIHSIARALATTPRTLQRRLAAERLSYNAVLESTRRMVAEHHLADRALSIAEVSYLSGYSEPAAFHRAFKRWTSQTPQMFRQAHFSVRQ